jgi:hypothetical protein
MARRSFALAACAAAPVLVALAAAPAHAHFVLKEPAAYSEQGTFGDPQKAPPCGDGQAGSPVTLTNAVTTFQAGSTIDITIDETVTHPGHYRVLLAPDPESLPADPVVTPASDSDCGSTTIETNPILPLLADGQLVHTSAFSGPQTMHVQLPAGMTCTNCTLQVVEFMSAHPALPPGGCFYHHCATVNVTSGPVPDAGPSGGGDADAAPTGGGGDGGGGGCAIAPGHSNGAGAGAAFFGLALLGLLATRRRRRS